MAATHRRLTGEADLPFDAAFDARARRAQSHDGRRLCPARCDADGRDLAGEKGVLSRKQARFQVVDIVATMAPLTKMAHQIVSAATMPSKPCARHSGSRSRRGRAITSNCRKTSRQSKRPISRRGRPPDRATCRRSCGVGPSGRLILKSERPLVMLGAAASPSASADALSDFVKAPANPVFQHSDGKGLPRRDNGSRAPFSDDGCDAFLASRRVLGVCGDGAFLMNSQELETAARLGLSLVVLILRAMPTG